MLGFAALVLGTLVGMERRASGGVLAPILTHVTWSISMLLVLPALFGERPMPRRGACLTSWTCPARP